MNLTKVSAIAEILSSIAIVLTLVYLAIQTQQNTESNQSAVRQSMLESDMGILFSNNGAIMRDPDAMTEEEKVGYLTTYVAMIRSRESYWAEYQSGNLDEETYRSYIDPFVRVTFSSEFSRLIWESRAELGVFRSGFVADVNAMGAEGNMLAPVYEEIGN